MIINMMNNLTKKLLSEFQVNLHQIFAWVVVSYKISSRIFPFIDFFSSKNNS